MPINEYREQKIKSLDREIEAIKRRLSVVNGCGWDIVVGVDKYGLLQLEKITGEDIPLKLMHASFESGFDEGQVKVSLYLLVDKIVVSKKWVVKADWIDTEKKYWRGRVIEVKQYLSGNCPLYKFGEIVRYGQICLSDPYGYKLEFF